MSAGRIKVTVGVCGGIAAYKAVELVRLLQKAGLDPHVVMTQAAQHFVTPLTFAAISGHKVITSLWDDSAIAAPTPEDAIEHITEAQTTQTLIVVPATADILAKFAHGLADDFLSTLYLATTAPVIAAPAMNVNMWSHPATQANISTLRQRGVRIVEPGSGYLACGMVGDGRLADNEAIVAATLQAATLQAVDRTPERAANKQQDLAGETVLITAGGTREAIDPVRFLGNRSSGRMGYTLAEAAAQRGARVVLISAPTHLQPPPACQVIPVISAAQMREAVLEQLPRATLLIMAAAVSDFTVRHPAPHKIKRNGSLLLELDPTQDILREAIAHRPPGALIIGFAAETDPSALLINARAKLEKKGADAIVANDVSGTAQGFDSDYNSGTFITHHDQIDIPATTKQAMANHILDQTLALKATILIPTGK